MKMNKLSDTEYASSPVFVGAPDKARHFTNTWDSCEHDWTVQTESPHPQVSEVKIFIEACSNCFGTRFRVTGPQAKVTPVAESMDDSQKLFP